MASFLIFLFVTLQPQLASQFFPRRRERLKAEFIHQVQRDHYLHPQLFWQFREFYSPGFVRFDEKLADVAGILRLPRYPFTQPRTILLHFSSPHIESWDSAVSTAQAERYLKPLSGTGEMGAPIVYYQDEMTRIFSADGKTLQIIFLKPLAEMMIANGFFDYTEYEREAFNHMYWLNETWVY